MRSLLRHRSKGGFFVLAFFCWLLCPQQTVSQELQQTKESTGSADPGRDPTASFPATTLPNGRRLTPEGGWIKVAPYPFALALRADGGQVVMPSIGWPFALNVIDDPSFAPSVHRHVANGAAKSSRVRQLPPGHKSDPDLQVLTGVVYSADGKLLYISTGDTGALDVYSTVDWSRVAHLSLNGSAGGKSYEHSFAAALALSPDGQTLFVVDQGNWRVVMVDTALRRIAGTLPTGVNPYGIALSPDGHRLYVTNSGLFEYKPVGGVEANDVRETGLHFPPFGWPSKEARSGAVAEGKDVPGLGPENDPNGSSLWTYDVSSARSARLLSKLRLGERIGADSDQAAKLAIGGAAPMGVIADVSRVYVALAHQDSIAVITADGSRMLDEIALTPFFGPRFRDRLGRPLRGVMPAGLALRGGRLYVTEAGINAVAVVDTRTNHVLGHLPVGWFPTAAAVSPDGRSLYVVNTKGKGTGPNGGAAFDRTQSGSYIGELEFGSLSVVPLGPEARLGEATRQVVENNLAAVAKQAAMPRLKHVFLVIRENRTFDEIFGDLPGADGDPKLAHWGMHGWMAGDPADKSYRVTPNARALAERFATSDRFFVDSDVSADGHRWVVAAAETPWFHVAWTSNYGGRRTEDARSAAPGRRALGGGNDGPMPEDEPEFGTLWEHVSDAGLTVRNYGEGLELAGSAEIAGAEPEGQRLVLNAPLPQPVFLSSDRSFATFNLGIPDQVRAAEFTKDFAQVLASGAAPSLVVIRLPGDHTAAPRPADGYPDRASYVADNDLALGKIVDMISHSPVWEQSAILVTEDDAQGGVDHVDAHRSVMLAMSPWVRRGVISHRHSSMGSLQKTAYELLGVGPLNLEDALAGDLTDLFTMTPDLTPFSAVASDPRVFDPAKAKIAHPGSAAEARELLDCDDPDDIRRQFRPASKSARARRTAVRKGE